MRTWFMNKKSESKNRCIGSLAQPVRYPGNVASFLRGSGLLALIYVATLMNNFGTMRFTTLNNAAASKCTFKTT